MKISRNSATNGRDERNDRELPRFYTINECELRNGLINWIRLRKTCSIDTVARLKMQRSLAATRRDIRSINDTTTTTACCVRIDEFSSFNCMHQLKGCHLIKRRPLYRASSSPTTFADFLREISTFSAILTLETLNQLVNDYFSGLVSRQSLRTNLSRVSFASFIPF